MTEVILFSSNFPSTSRSSSPCGRLNPNHGSHPNTLINSPAVEETQEEEELVRVRKRKERDKEGDQLSVLTLVIAVFRKSLFGCSSRTSAKLSSMEIGWPSNVRHVAHVTFDRFNGFLGLPVEFEPEVPRRAPSASTNVFGVSTESMQLSFDARGNCVPTILLLLQRHLYAQGGLEAEGIFRINAGDSQDEYVREQLNRGVVPDGVDVHCLAGLIKAWFRELPTGVLDPLSREQVMQYQSEEECAQLVRLLPLTKAALLDWAVNLMADVAEQENLNKMNAHNVAMVFAPNMTQMADPLIALMYAVQVMNFLKTLIIKTLGEREESMRESTPVSNLNSFDDAHHSSSQLTVNNGRENGNDRSEEEEVIFHEEPSMECPGNLTEAGSETESGSNNLSTSAEINVTAAGNKLLVDCCPCSVVSQVCSLTNGLQDSSFACLTTSLKCSKKVVELPAEKNQGTAMVGLINSRTELAEAWR